MKNLLIGFTVVIVVGLIVGGICYVQYINRNKEPSYTADEVYSNECARRGGDTTTKTGYQNGLYVQEYKCEVK